VSTTAPEQGEGTGPAARTWNRRRLAKVTLLCWIVTFGLGAVWSLSTPLWTTPDAPAHDLMAYHSVRDLTITSTDVYQSGVTSNAITAAPEGLVRSAATVKCYGFKPTVPASCLKYPSDADKLVDFVNPAGRNMPTYYLATGWPSLLVSVKHVIWADRLAALAIASFFSAWAASAALTRRRPSIALTGVAIAMTPMVLYFSGAVNPNSLEITAGAALAACGVAFIQERDNQWLAHVMFRRAMVAATVMVTIRMLAPVWVLCCVAALLLLTTRQHWRHMLSRRGLPWLALPALGAVFDLVWTTTSGVTQFQEEPKFHNSLWHNLMLSKNVIEGNHIQQQIGLFGWLDTPLFPGTYTLFEMAALFLMFVACIKLSSREFAAVALLFAGQYLLPIVLQALQWNTNGQVWQGRYTLPLTVALPIFTLMLSAPRWGRSSDLRRITWTFPVALGLLAWVHFRALTVEMRRNVSGAGGPSIIHGPWQPPLGAATLLIVEALLLIGVVGFMVHLYRQDRPLSWAGAGGARTEDTVSSPSGGVAPLAT
jgi:hypothetical protein